MRVGIGAEYLSSNGGGVETYIANLLRELPRAGVDDVFKAYVCGDAQQHWQGKFDDRVELERVGPSRWWAIPAGIPYELARRPVDVFHAPFVMPPFGGTPTVLTIHDISFEIFPELVPWLVRQRLSTLTAMGVRRASRIAASSNHTKDTICDVYGVDPSRVTVVPLAADAQFDAAPAPDDPEVLRRHGLEDGSYLLYVGQVETRKNVGRMLEAYDLLRREEHVPPLVIAGRFHWFHAEILETAKRLDFGDQVRFLGHVPGGDLPALFRGARLFVFPSHTEGFGLPPLEAMVSGTPVVCSNATALPEVAGEAAVYFDPHDATEMAGAMSDVLSDDERSKELARLGLERAKIFNWRSTAEKMLDLYREVADDR